MFNETQYLNDLSDYVHGGDTLYYAATVNTSGDPLGIIPGGTGPGDRAKIQQIIADIQSNGFVILNQEILPGAGSIAFNVRAPGDFADSHDVQALFDGIVQSSGLRLLASNLQHRALNLAGPGTINPDADKGVIEVAGEWWGSGISRALENIGSPLGISGSMVGLGIGFLLVAMLMRR